MAIRNVRIDGDEVLRKVCREVTEVTPRTKTLIGDMFDTMYEADGVGLAAPQVGILKRIVVIDIQEDDKTPLCLINPVIVESDGEQTGDEGCLSLPGFVGEVTRPNHIICEAYDENMNKITVEATELLARAICHEVDHLDGILYKDKTNDGLHRAEAKDK